MQTNWVKVTMALAILVALTAGASAKDAPKASGGDGMVVKIDGKMYKLVSLPEAKDAKAKGEADKQAKAKDDRRDGKAGKPKDARKDKDDDEKDAKAKDGKAVGAASLIGKKVILLVDGRQYVAVILGDAAGKVEAGRRAKGDDEKSAKSGKDKDDDEKDAKARDKKGKDGEKDAKAKKDKGDDEKDAKARDKKDKDGEKDAKARKDKDDDEKDAKARDKKDKDDDD